MKRRKVEPFAYSGFLAALFVFIGIVLTGVYLAEYNCNQLLGVNEPVQVFGFRHSDLGTYTLTAFGRTYHGRQVVEYGRVEFTPGRIYLDMIGKPIVIPTKIEIGSIENVTSMIRSDKQSDR